MRSSRGFVAGAHSIVRGTVLAIAVLAGCGAPPAGDGEDLGAIDQDLQCKAVYKDQYHSTGTPCGTTSHSSICGPTSAAMMRQAMTCGLCNPTPGTVRAWYDQTNGTANCCMTGTNASTCVIGADTHRLFRAMNRDHQDGCPAYTMADKCYSGSAGYTIADLKRDLSASGGYVAVVNGNMAKVASRCCSCWYHRCTTNADCGTGLTCSNGVCEFNHTIYVHSYDPATDTFAVYDPDACNSGHRQPAPSNWPAADLNALSAGFYHGDSRYLCVMIGKGGVSADCSGLPKPAVPVPSEPGAGLNFACGNSMRDEGTGWVDWSYGYYKADCSRSQAATGLSMSTTSPGWAHDLLCRLDDAALYPHATCTTRVFDHADARGTTALGDWDPGFYKGECAADEYVASASQSTDLKLHALQCCKGQVQHTDCQAVALEGGGASEDPPTNDWDPGFWKAECGGGRFLAGASHKEGVPHSILCCGVHIPPDAGVPGPDASLPEPPDAATPEVDGGAEAFPDAGVAVEAPDASADLGSPDGGVVGNGGGCGCGAVPGGAGYAALTLVLLGWARGLRRRH